MGTTTIAAGAAGSAGVVYNAALFSQIWKGNGKFWSRLAGPAPSSGMVKAMLEKGRDFSVETDQEAYPICRITDLQNKPGSQVSVDLVHANTVRPVMGDAEIKGRRGTTTFASQQFEINSFTIGWDGGGKMAQKRTPHNLKSLARSGVMRNVASYLDDLKIVQLAGARGDDTTSGNAGWVLPLADDPEFDELCINPILAPTYNRYLIAAGASDALISDISDMDTTNFLTLTDVARIAQFNRESSNPMGAVMFPDDPAAETAPLGVLLVTARQWFWLEQYHSGTGKDWQTFLQNAGMRGAQNALFKGGRSGMWNGILVTQYPRPIRFNQGSTVTVATSASAYTETTTTVPTFDATATNNADFAVDRAIYLGSQALAELWGADNATGLPTDWYDGTENDGRRPVFSLQGIAGISKLRFRDRAGVDWDHGVTVIDSYAPNSAKVAALV